MPYQDFRQFLDMLRQHGELVDVNRPIALNDVGKEMKQNYVRQGPALMFNQNGTDYPLVAGIYSTRSKALLAFEADEDTIFDKVLTGLDKPITLKVAAGGRISRCPNWTKPRARRPPPSDSALPAGRADDRRRNDRPREAAMAALRCGTDRKRTGNACGSGSRVAE